MRRVTCQILSASVRVRGEAQETHNVQTQQFAMSGALEDVAWID